MSNERDLIWVSKEFAERYKALESDVNKRAEQIQIFEEYCTKLSEECRKEAKSNFESIQEDLAIFNGFMLQHKQAFEKAKKEQFEATYAMWEKYDSDVSELQRKITNTKNLLKPLFDELKELQECFNTFDQWGARKLAEVVQSIGAIGTVEREMITFLIKNFKKERVK